MKKYFKYLWCFGLLIFGLILTSCDIGSTTPGTVAIKSIKATQDTISFDLSTSGDTDTIGLIDANLYLDGELVNSIDDITLDKLTGNKFEGLLTYKDYSLEIVYTNSNKEPITLTKEMRTAPADIGVDTIVVMNDDDIYVGDIIDLKIMLNNPDNAVISTITVDGKKLDVASSKFTNEVTTSLTCNFIGQEWHIKVDAVTVMVNNVSVEYRITTDNSIDVPIKGSMTFEEFQIKDDLAFVKLNEEFTVSFDIIGDNIDLYEIASIVINGKTYSKEQLAIVGNRVYVNVSLSKQGVNEIKFTKITLKKAGVEIYSDIDLVIEVYVAESSDEILINSIDDLIAIKHDEYNMYRLTTNLDFTGVVFTPWARFRGYFNGDYHTISNLKISGNGSLGLTLDNEGVISNLIFETPSIELTTKNDNSYVGLIAAKNNGIIRKIYINNLTISGTISNGFVGGIAGENSGFVTDCSIIGSIALDSSGSYIGGLVANNNETIVTNVSYVNITATKASVSGIIAKENKGSLNVSNYYYLGQVVIGKNVNELGETFNYEEFMSPTWFIDTLGWANSSTYIDLSLVPVSYALGSKANPIVINNVTAFMNLDSLNGYYKLNADLDFTGITFTPISNFSSILDGNNHVIKGINLVSDKGYVGLFENLTGIVKNLTIKELTFTVSDSMNTYVGTIAGFASSAIIENVIIEETCIINVSKLNVSADNSTTFVGGLVGYANETSIKNCASLANITVKVKAEHHYIIVLTGGVVGYNNLGSILEVASNANIVVEVVGNEASSAYVGGIAGYNLDGILEELYAQGTLSLKGTFKKANVGSVYGGNDSTSVRLIYGLEGQSILLNNVQVGQSIAVHKLVNFVPLEDINEWNQSRRWGILG
jgi:hypothetical protein